MQERPRERRIPWHARMHATPTCIPLPLIYAFIMNVLSSMTDVIYCGSSAFLVLPAFLQFPP